MSLSYYRFILLAVMPSHLTVIKIYDSDWAWLSRRAASESLREEGGHCFGVTRGRKGRLQQPLLGRLQNNYKPPSCAD